MGEVNSFGLTDMQMRFCHEYMIDMNATKAGIRAGYNKGSGKRVVRKAEVKAYIASLQEHALRRLAITADRVLEECAKIAFADLREALGPDGNFLPVAQLNNDIAGAIAAIECYEEKCSGNGPGAIVRKVRMADKLRALEYLGKFLGMFRTDGVEHSTEFVVNIG